MPGREDSAAQEGLTRFVNIVSLYSICRTAGGMELIWRIESVMWSWVYNIYNGLSSEIVAGLRVQTNILL